MSSSIQVASVPEGRVDAARAVAAALMAADRIALTTHVNADGDGTGSEVGLVHLLGSLGKQVVIANPTPVPERFGFLLKGIESCDHSGRASQALRDADLALILDISDIDRIGNLAASVSGRTGPVACVDHHASRGTLPPGPRLIDPAASATAELVHDLALVAGFRLSTEAARALYVGILTDTGAFRYSNTTPRVLRVAAGLLDAGVDPESIYEAVYATAPAGRIRLAAEVLATLEVDPMVGLSWLTVPDGALERHGATADDLDGLVEFARSVQGTRLALLFRHLAGGKVKVSLRSVGDFDVSEFARRFGGGGHARASGASLAGGMEEVRRMVIEAARSALGAR